jgi:hypothetical protein
MMETLRDYEIEVCPTHSEEAEVEVEVDDDEVNSLSSVTNSNFPAEVAAESDESEPIIVDKFKPRSIIWKFFKVYKDKALDKYAHCTICNQKVLYTSHHSNSLVPLIIYLVRTGLIEKLNNIETSLQVRSLARVMLDCFNQHWGGGLPGTVTREHMTEGPNRRPKGIPLLT